MDDSPLKPKFQARLSVRLIGGLVALIVLLTSVSFGVIWYQGRPLLESLNHKAQTQLGHNIALALGQQMRLVEGIARSLAAMGVNLPKQDALYHAAIPPLLDQAGLSSLIAGGGLWPEPDAFESGVERHSFFWGRNQAGKLEFFEDYNDPQGAGYHHEEWYVPARLLPLGSVYWSKSYTDPYSQQPMVTCSAPMLGPEGEFLGVATLDLMLDGVSRVLKRLTADLEAYAFVVDRNNKFITFPQSELVIRKRGEETPDYIYTGELAAAYPTFSKIDRHLVQLEARRLRALNKSDSKHWVDWLQNNSYQIDRNESERIATHLWQSRESKEAYPQEVDRFSAEQDILLNQAVTVVIFQMPVTNWKIVTVFKLAAYRSVTDGISLQLIGYISVATLIFGLLAFALLKEGVLRRITAMVELLSESVAGNDGQALALDYRQPDELGLLAYWFNQRSQQLEQARDQAEKSSRAKSDFLASMSHELRTPLNSIIGFTRRLIARLEGEIDPRNYDALVTVNNNAQHLSSLINDILDLARIESGEERLVLTAVDVNSLLAAAADQVRGLAEDKKLTLQVLPLKDALNCQCDKRKVLQVLVNLLANGIKATEYGGLELRASLTALDGEAALALAVIDSGIGISKQDQEKLFKRFSQLDNRIGAEKGTGLGLYLAALFARMHGGRVEVQSELGEGACFTLLLPLSGPESTSA